jgi:integrase/recombinase XerD
LPVISNVDYNRYLKVIAQAAGIDKPISTHWGRHTAAMYWLNHGIPLEVVSRCLGHSSTRITQSTYARFETGAIKDAFDKMDKESWMVG